MGKKKKLKRALRITHRELEWVRKDLGGRLDALEEFVRWIHPDVREEYEKIHGRLPIRPFIDSHAFDEAVYNALKPMLYFSVKDSEVN